jgi:hypothetical protein
MEVSPVKAPLLIPELREYIATRKIEALKAFCENTPSTVVADYLAAFAPDEIWRIIRGRGSIGSLLGKSDVFVSGEEHICRILAGQNRGGHWERPWSASGDCDPDRHDFVHRRCQVQAESCRCCQALPSTPSLISPG